MIANLLNKIVAETTDENYNEQDSKFSSVILSGTSELRDFKYSKALQQKWNKYDYTIVVKHSLQLVGKLNENQKLFLKSLQFDGVISDKWSNRIVIEEDPMLDHNWRESLDDETVDFIDTTPKPSIPLSRQYLTYCYESACMNFRISFRGFVYGYYYEPVELTLEMVSKLMKINSLEQMHEFIDEYETHFDALTKSKTKIILNIATDLVNYPHKFSEEDIRKFVIYGALSFINISNEREVTSSHISGSSDDDEDDD